MNRNKKVSAIICCAVIVLNMVLFPLNGIGIASVAAASEETGRISSEITSDTQADVVISNRQEFMDFAKGITTHENKKGITVRENDHEENDDDVVVLLTADIDFEGDEVDCLVGGEFYGTFDGAGHSIKGVTASSGAVFNINHGTVKNLVLENSKILGAEYAGGIVGENYGTIDNCIVEEDVSINLGKESWEVGGIVGLNMGTVINCCNKADVTKEGEGNVGGIAGSVGGIWGKYLRSGFILNSCNIGNVTRDSNGTRYVGGLTGDFVQGNIENCYNIGEVSSGNSFVGSSGKYTTLVNCTSGKSEEYMRSQDFLEYLNENVGNQKGWKHWKFYDDFPYPIHERQYTITFPDEGMMHGTFSVESNYLYAGTEVEVTVKPDLGYRCDNVMVRKEDGTSVSYTETDDGFSFIMPESSVVITGEFLEIEDMSDYASGIWLNETKKDLKVGGSFNMAQEIIYLDGSREEIPPEMCAYSSSNPAVVTVSDDGTVTAVGYGTAKVTVAFKDLSAACAVEVISPVLKLTADKKTMRVYGSFQIDGVMGYPGEVVDSVPGAACTYSGYDTKIVSVSASGKVTATGFGTTTIEVSYNGVSATCNVTVEPPKDLMVTKDVTLSPGQSCKLSPYFLYADNSTQNVAGHCTYQNGDPQRLSLNGRQITAVGNSGGSAVVTVSCLGLSANCKVNLAKLSASCIKKTVKLSHGRSYSLLDNVRSNATGNYLKKKMTWKTNKKSIVKIKKNKTIVAKKKGSCKLSGYIGGKKLLSFKVRVR